MAVYLVQRVGYVGVVLVIMSVLVFLATHALPASTAEVILGQYATPETIAALERKLGLTRPLFEQSAIGRQACCAAISGGRWSWKCR